MQNAPQGLCKGSLVAYVIEVVAFSKNSVINGGVNGGASDVGGANGGVNDRVNDGVNRVSDEVNGVNDGVNDGNDRVNDGNDGARKEIVAFVTFIMKNEGLRANKIAALMVKSTPTIERYLIFARKYGIIEFRGATKTGGYFITKSLRELIENKKKQ